MSKAKTTKKPLGRPRIHPIRRVRRNLNIERNAQFDANLATMMEAKQLNQTEAIKEAVDFYVRFFELMKTTNNVVCPRCNGEGHIALRGDDDTPCPECAPKEQDTPY